MSMSCPSVAVNVYAKTSSVSFIVFLVASSILMVEVSRDTFQTACIRRCRLKALPIRPQARGLVTGLLVPLTIRFVEAMQRYLVHACVVWTFFSMLLFANNGLSATNVILNGVAVAFVCNLDDLFADFFAPHSLERSVAIEALRSFYIDGIRDDAHLASTLRQAKRTAHARAFFAFLAFVRGYHKFKSSSCVGLVYDICGLACCYLIWFGAIVEIVVGSLFLPRHSARQWLGSACFLALHELAEVVVVCLVITLSTLAVDDLFWGDSLGEGWGEEAPGYLDATFGGLKYV